MLLLIILGIISLTGIGATVLHILRDGYGRVPERPGAARASEPARGSRSRDFA